MNISSLFQIYEHLYNRFGPQHWWPAETPFEVVVGAILTQNTNWNNVETAIANLRTAEALNLNGIAELERNELERLIRSSGYFRQKADRLQTFCRFVQEEHDGCLDRLFELPDDLLRQTLLQRPGIGPETADSIMLYAAGRTSFVIDAYTHRILERIGLQATTKSYEQTRMLFMDNLPARVELFNEYHALLVRLAKEHCRKRNPLCSCCPLVELCDYGQDRQGD